MCTKTVRSYTNLRYLSAIHPQKFVNYWKCGFCSECIAEKRAEFQLRSYYEAKSCVSRGGFVLFDTLTYRDSSLKWFSDFFPKAIGQPWNFPAFSRYDITQFFKELNTVLDRLGYDVRGNMRHLLTSEYGSDPDRTHRPHYHVLFFVNFPIHPEVLSYIIGEVWQHGRTDGCWYKGARYVRYQRVFRNLGSDLRKVSNYVAKYVGKDLFLYKHLFRRCVRSFYELYPDWTKSYQKRLEFRRFCNQVLPFHLQSDGFGLSALDYFTVGEIALNDYLTMPSSDGKVVRKVSLPLYFRRKLFYQLQNVEGRPSWRLTDFGRSCCVRRFGSSVQNFALKLKSYDQHCDAERLARYHLLRRGMLADELTLSTCDDAKLLEISVGNLPEDLSFLKNEGLLYYNYSTEDQSFKFGRHLSDLERTGVSWFDRCLDRPARCWSPAEFAAHPPDGLVVYSDPECDAFLDNFFSWLRQMGDSMDFLNWKKCCLIDHYKNIGILDEFCLK